MGYHIILKPKDSDICSVFVHTLEDLAGVHGLSDDSIVYEGDDAWRPFKVGASEKFRNFSEDWFRAGIKAQRSFRKLAEEKGYVLETLSQDQNSFKSYVSQSAVTIKRGDFLVRNVRNLEIEVKCRSFYNQDGQTWFNFNKIHLEQHRNMQKFSRTPIAVALFKREKDVPVEDSLRMTMIDHLSGIAKDCLEIQKGFGAVYRFPVSETKTGFGLLDELKAGLG